MSAFRVGYASTSNRALAATLAVLVIALAVAPWWADRQGLRLLSEVGSPGTELEFAL